MQCLLKHGVKNLKYSADFLARVNGVLDTFPLAAPRIYLVIMFVLSSSRLRKVKAIQSSSVE